MIWREIFEGFSQDAGRAEEAETFCASPFIEDLLIVTIFSLILLDGHCTLLDPKFIDLLNRDLDLIPIRRSGSIGNIRILTMLSKIQRNSRKDIDFLKILMIRSLSEHIFLQW